MSRRKRDDQAVDDLAADLDRHLVQAVELPELLAMDLPERRNLLTPIVPEQGLVLVHAPRGLGKTHFALGVGFAIASGGAFLRWQADQPGGVLYVDGEMPAVVLQERLARIVESSEKDLVAPFRLITPDLNRDTGLPDLASRLGQAAIDRHVGDDIKLLVVDNLSSLCRSGVENEAESWQPIQTWALRHRAAGRSVLFIHHSGKGGAQRGTSRREDVLDTVIGLKRPADYTAERGARFDVEVEKCRGFFGEAARSFTAELTVDRAGRQTWLISDLEVARAERIVELHQDGMKPNEIAQELQINRSTVYRKLKAEGLLPDRKPSGKVVPFEPKKRRQRKDTDE